MKITQKTSLKQLAVIVCDHLNKEGIEAVLSGGAVVTIYSKALYQSYDLDFITFADRKKIQKAMEKLGFKKEKGRYYTHPGTKYFVEFPPGPLAIGEEIVKSWSTMKTKSGKLFLLTPTQCIMDRLCAFYHWNDYQSLEQAILVAKKHKVTMSKIKKWSLKEEMNEKFEIFRKKLGFQLKR